MTEATSRLLSMDESQRWKLLVDSMVDYAIFMLDAEGRVASWNPGAEKTKGYKAEEIIGRHFSVFYTEEDRAAHLPETALKTAERDGHVELEGWRVRKDGSAFWGIVLIDPVRDEQGNLLGFAKVTRDITERVQTRHALMESERRFRLFVQSVTDYAIFMLDASGHVANWNLGAQRIKGYSESEIIGQHFSIFYTEEDRAADLPQKMLQTVQERGRYSAEGWRLRKDGSRFLAHVELSPVHEANGSLIGYAKITRDITEQRRTESDLQRTREALFQAQKMEAIGQLTGGIAHDFNNLLTVIINSLDMLSKKPLSDKEKRHLDNAQMSASRGATLTRQLLAFARQQALAPRLQDINSLITGFDPVLRGAAGAPVKLVLKLAKALPATHIDGAQFESALLNMVVNARDAMPDGGEIQIETALARFDGPHGSTVEPLAAGRYLVVAVTDQGPGIPPELQRRIFDPFFTTKAVGKGTGLGLSQVYGFVTQSGGGVEIVRSDASGTCLRLYLPASSRPVDTAHDDDKTYSAHIPAGIEVLVVEDEESVRESAVALFEALGCKVSAVSSGIAALSELSQNTAIKVVFSDIVMLSGENGLRLAERVQKDYPGVHIILTSGHPGSRTELPPHLAFVPKPYRKEDLAANLSVLGIPIANQS